MLGFFAVLLAIAASLLLILRMVSDNDSATPDKIHEGKIGGWRSFLSSRNETIAKFVICFSLCGVLFAANLWPLALMVMIAVGGISAIEIWKKKSIRLMEEMIPQSLLAQKQMSEQEAIQVLGLESDFDQAAIKAAHRRLIVQMHPDSGGNDYLAAKINDARDVLAEKIEKKIE